MGVCSESRQKQVKIFSLGKQSLETIFENYKSFKKVLEVRALRKQHYYKKLVKQ